MTVPATIKQSDLTRAAKVARAQGCVVRITAGNVTFEVVPDNHNGNDGKKRPIEKKPLVL